MLHPGAQHHRREGGILGTSWSSTLFGVDAGFDVPLAAGHRCEPDLACGRTHVPGSGWCRPGELRAGANEPVRDGEATCDPPIRSLNPPAHDGPRRELSYR